MVRNATIRGIADTIDGGITLVRNVPGQALAIYKVLPPYEKTLLHRKIGLGEVQQDTLKRAAPFISLAVIGIVAFNIYRSLK